MPATHTLTFSSASVNQTGRLLKIVLSVNPAPSGWGEPQLSASISPSLTNGVRTITGLTGTNPDFTPMFGLARVTGGVLYWTLCYWISDAKRILWSESDQTWTLSWTGGAIASDSGHANFAEGSRSNAAVTVYAVTGSDGYAVLTPRDHTFTTRMDPNSQGAPGNLYQWLKADAGVLNPTGGNAVAGDHVATWTDQSQHSPTFDAHQTDDTKRPTYRTTNGPGNKPYIEFTTGKVLHGTHSLTPSSSSCTVFMVFKAASNSGESNNTTLIYQQRGTQSTDDDILKLTWDTSDLVHTPTCFNGVVPWSPGADTNPLPDEWQVLAFRVTHSSGTELSPATLGVLHYTAVALNPPASDGTWRYGAQVATDTSVHNALVGAIAEIIVYDAALTDAQMQSLMAGLMYKYDIKARQIYFAPDNVTPAGSDSNSGLFTTAPRRSLSKIADYMRPGVGDQALLKRGTTFPDEPIVAAQSQLAANLKSGFSRRWPTVIGIYGTATDGGRPIVQHHDDGVAPPNTGPVSGLKLLNPVNYLHINGINFYRHKADPGNTNDFVGEAAVLNDSHGIDILPNDQINWIAVSDCKFRWEGDGITIQNDHGGQGLLFLRNVIIDSYEHDGAHKAQGIYVATLSTAPNECVENTIYRAGFPEDNFNPRRLPNSTPTEFSHAIYCNNDAPMNYLAVDIIGNWLMQSAAHGFQARRGGVVALNVCYLNAVGGNLGFRLDLSEEVGAWRNVIDRGRSIGTDPMNPDRNWGLWIDGPLYAVLLENIIRLPQDPMVPPVGNGWGIFDDNGLRSGQRIYIRNNSIDIVKTTAIGRLVDDLSSDATFVEFVVDGNRVRQDDSSYFATECNVGTAHTTWDHNKYRITTTNTAWVYDGVGLTFANWQGTGTGQPHFDANGTASPSLSLWANRGVHLGDYCDQNFGTTGATPDDLIGYLIGRGPVVTDAKYLAETAVAYYVVGYT